MRDTIKVRQWSTPAGGYPRRSQGNAAIVDYPYSRGYYQVYRTGPPGGPKYDWCYVCKRVTVTGLEIHGQTWMVDDMPHWWAILEHAQAYSGRVLCAGLGLGLIIHAMQFVDAITAITVVERSCDVIDLVGPLLPVGKPLEIVHAEWDQYSRQYLDHHVDGVFFDLYVGDGPSLVPQAIREMIELRRRFPDVPVRIHGFQNEALAATADQVLRTDRLNQRLR